MAKTKTKSSSLLVDRPPGINISRKDWIKYHLDLEIRRQWGLCLAQFSHLIDWDSIKTLGEARKKVIRLRNLGLFDRSKVEVK